MVPDPTPDRQNFDFDRTYKRPALWRQLKEGFAGFYRADLLFRRLERMSLLAPDQAGHDASGNFGCPRQNLILAVFAFSVMSPAERRAMRDRYWRWREIIACSPHVRHTEPPREAPAAEMLSGRRPEGDRA